MNNLLNLSAEEHRRRQQNLKDAYASVASCMAEHTVYGYMAGQVNYNMGEYPKRFSMAPTDYDYKLLRQFADHGVKVIGFHEEWNDPIRALGANKFTPFDPEGMKAFVDLVHSLGMKIRVYASTGFFSMYDPDFNPEWNSLDFCLAEIYFTYAYCSPASAEWRAYLLPKLERIMLEYGVDGLYNDMGYHPLWRYQFAPSTKLPVGHPAKQLPYPPAGQFKHVSPGPETPENHSAIVDLLGIVYDMVHKHGGFYHLHSGGAGRIPTDVKVYDYLWVGEAVLDTTSMRRKVMNYSPYIVPCPDRRFTVAESEDEMYLDTIPYMQFPLRLDGRPLTGERGMVPDIKYHEDDFITNTCRSTWKYYQDNPDAYPTFGWWDSVPGRPDARSTWLRYLDLYLPMIKDGSKVWVDIKESDLFVGTLQNDLVASLFVNDQTYMVLANYSKSPLEVKCTKEWRNRETSEVKNQWSVPARGLLFLKVV